LAPAVVERDLPRAVAGEDDTAARAKLRFVSLGVAILVAQLALPSMDLT
jgi:hypothetical protein